MLSWLRNRWHARLRAIDLVVLWPSCKRHAHNLEHARAAFAVHARRDRAWLALGEEELARTINRLE